MDDKLEQTRLPQGTLRVRRKKKLLLQFSLTRRPSFEVHYSHYFLPLHIGGHLLSPLPISLLVAQFPACVVSFSENCCSLRIAG